MSPMATLSPQGLKTFAGLRRLGSAESEGSSAIGPGTHVHARQKKALGDEDTGKQTRLRSHSSMNESAMSVDTTRSFTNGDGARHIELQRRRRDVISHGLQAMADSLAAENGGSTRSKAARLAIAGLSTLLVGLAGSPGGPAGAVAGGELGAASATAAAAGVIAASAGAAGADGIASPFPSVAGPINGGTNGPMPDAARSRGLA